MLPSIAAERRQNVAPGASPGLHSFAAPRLNMDGRMTSPAEVEMECDGDYQLAEAAAGAAGCCSFTSRTSREL